jgi:lysophospholipase L1-like esterase
VRRRRVAAFLPILAATLIALLATACGSASPAALQSAPNVGDAGKPEVYAALGASETVGTGLNDEALRMRATWPQLFYNDALPRAATLYNFAVPGITTNSALLSELPGALAVHPTVATVFFNIDDLVRGVPAAQYESNLDGIVHALRQGGKTVVLVGNAPHIDQLPAYRACLSGLELCVLGRGAAVPSPAVINAEVDAYNAAVSRVVAREGAVLVDLATHASDFSFNPAYIASDGLHPSAQGHAALAALFVDAYRTAIHAH